MLNKVPEVTLYFWVIKILCTTVGETAADYLNENLGFGLTNTTSSCRAVLVVALVFQFRLRRYVPGVYWLAVVLISVVGTLITDNLTDNFGVPLVTTTIVFASRWRRRSRPGTRASGRCRSTRSSPPGARRSTGWPSCSPSRSAPRRATSSPSGSRLGYWQSALIFAALIAVVVVAHVRFALNAVLAFWLAYILTRPLGASIGDYLSQPRADGGLGLGTTVTSVIFLAHDPRRGRLPDGHEARPDRRPSAAVAARRASAGARVLVVANKTAATPERWSMRCAACRCRAGRVRDARAEPRASGVRPHQPGHRRGRADARAGAAATRAGSRHRGRRAASPTARTPTTTSSRSSAGASTARSSSRPCRATCRTGCTSTSPSASPISAIR